MTSLLINGSLCIEEPQIILLDKDGTLIDIHHYWASMIRIRAQNICDKWFPGHRDREVIEERLTDAMGVDLGSGRMKPEGPVGVKPRPHIVQVAVGVVCEFGAGIGLEEMEVMFCQVDDQTASDMQPLLRVLPGVEDFLARAQKSGIELAVVSTDISQRAHGALEALGIDGYFQYIVCGDMVANAKPASDMVNFILDKKDYPLEKMVVIGDHPVDIQMGKNAGIGCNIGVLTGLASKDAFASLDCEIIENFNQLEVRDQC